MRANTAVRDYLAAHNTWHPQDLYTVTLVDGTVLWWAEKVTVTIGGQPYTAGAPSPLIVSRSTIRWTRGTEVSEVTLTLGVGAAMLVSGRTLASIALDGRLAGATVRIDRLIGATATDVSLGLVWLFSGSISEIPQVSASLIRVTVRSDLDRLTTQWPPRLIQPACPYTFCSPACGLSAATYSVSRAVTGTPTVSTVPINGGAADGYYDLGIARFTSGACAGLSRQVRVHASGILTLAAPLPRAPAAGDTCTAMRGCAKTQAACSGYGNLGRLGGYPYAQQDRE